MPQNPYDFGLWFYSHFVQPLLDIAKNTDLLGFSLFSWIMGIAILALAVRFLRSLFGHSDSDNN